MNYKTELKRFSLKWFGMEPDKKGEYCHYEQVSESFDKLYLQIRNIENELIKTNRGAARVNNISKARWEEIVKLKEELRSLDRADTILRILFAISLMANGFLLIWINR